MKKVISFVLALAMVLSVGATVAFAVTYHDMTVDGDFYISGGYYASGLEDIAVDPEGYYITQSGEQNGTIVVRGSSDVKITLDGVDLENDYNGDWSAINIDNSDVTLTLKNDNYLASDSNYRDYDEYAPLWVGNGSELTVNGNGSLNIQVDYYSGAAGIGSDYNCSFDSTVIIEGDAEVNITESYSGAGIGSGSGGEFTEDASVIVRGNAEVNIMNDEGAGIGSGALGNVNGNIRVEGNATVDILGGCCASAIGSGDGGDMNGDIFIGGNAVVDVSSDENAIGTGYDGDMNGKITVTDNANVTATSSFSPVIGSDNVMGEDAIVEISGNAVVKTEVLDDACPDIGSSGAFLGTVLLKDNATIEMDTYIGDIFGENEGVVKVDDTVTLNGQPAHDVIDELAKDVTVEKIVVEKEPEVTVNPAEELYWNYWRGVASDIRLNKTVATTVPADIDQSNLPTFIFTALKEAGNGKLTVTVGNTVYEMTSTNLPAKSTVFTYCNFSEMAKFVK